jgi:hypothetical protein
MLYCASYLYPRKERITAQHGIVCISPHVPRSDPAEGQVSLPRTSGVTVTLPTELNKQIHTYIRTDIGDMAKSQNPGIRVIIVSS